MSKNEAVLRHCLEQITLHTGATARAIGIYGGSGSGSSALVHQIARRADKLGKRVLHLDSGHFPDSQYIQQKLLHFLGVGTVNIPEGVDRLLPLCAAVMDLRRYDVLLLEDAQNYNGFSRRVTDCNTQALLHIMQLPQPPLIITAGPADAVEFHHSNFVDAGIASELRALPAMANDQSYAEFVSAVCEALSSGNHFVTQIDVNDLYQKSQGRVGQTVRLLEWLYLNASADVCFSKHELYRQTIPNEFDEDGEYADEDTEPGY